MSDLMQEILSCVYRIQMLQEQASFFTSSTTTFQSAVVAELAARTELELWLTVARERQ